MGDHELVVHKNSVFGLDIYVRVTPTATTAVAFKSNTVSEALADTCVIL